MKGRRSIIPYYYRPKSTKYSNETVSVALTVTTPVNANVTFPTGAHTGIIVVNPTNVFGNRKVKNFSIKLSANGNTQQILGALVYVPSGT